MDGENNGSKPYEQIDDLVGFPPIFGNTHVEFPRTALNGKLPSQSLTASLPLKSYRDPIGKDRLPLPPFLQGRTVKLRGCNIRSGKKISMNEDVLPYQKMGIFQLL